MSQLISVIIPVYNAQKHLAYCLDSLLLQTYQNWEAVCIDDGSTDASAEILQHFAAADKRIRVISQHNSGVSAARNKGLEAAQGELIAFIDADDMMHPQNLEILSQTLYESGAQLVCAPSLTIKADEQPEMPAYTGYTATQPSSPLIYFLTKKNCFDFNVWGKLYRRDFIGHLRFCSGLYYEDMLFNSQLAGRLQKLAVINVPLSFYRLSQGSIMRSDFTEKKLMSYDFILRQIHQMWGLRSDICSNYYQFIIMPTLGMIFRGYRRIKPLRPKISMVLRTLQQDGIISTNKLSLKMKLRFWRMLYQI